ncbi:Gfo/Idh/MocA family oxidoreductase [Streptomyces sp. RerS4]|uniref:Gfo/Idh/MocA family protein n=1 Tax=Streptomyces sp. RerS4 TaxID=2942449 RepID=UPI00201C56F1|nr:Gfo/Idh/MocA family oxidoreductase [Streptomyces sp. RerS4]UQX03432.1 Gfo/Idh/MocA family oxidoreductase [Streptomyces sp. RerS4]
MTAPPLRIGVMGAASIARRRVMPAMALDDGARITAVASRDPRKAAELAEAYGCRPVTGYAGLLELDDVDALYIPLPLALHAPWVEAALRAGKHVLAEKPLSADPATTRRLLDLAESRGVVLMENVMFVHHSQHAYAQRLVADGAIGELRSLHATFAIPRLHDTDIRLAPELGGGALWDVGLYPIRAALHFLGANLRVAGAVLTRGEGRRVDTSGAVLLSDPQGVSAHLTFGMEHSYTSQYEIRGSEGRIQVDHAFTPPADHAPALRLVTGAGTRTPALPPDDQVARTLGVFLSAVRARALPAGLAEASLRQAELLSAVHRAAGAPSATGL